MLSWDLFYKAFIFEHLPMVDPLPIVDLISMMDLIPVVDPNPIHGGPLTCGGFRYPIYVY